jgi:hypothetical protein
MTIRCGGMVRSITSAAHAIAAAVTAIVIACQWCRRKSLAGMQRYFSFSRPLSPGQSTRQDVAFSAFLTVPAGSGRASQQKRPLMSAMGHFRPIGTLPTLAACPLHLQERPNVGAAAK